VTTPARSREEDHTRYALLIYTQPGYAESVGEAEYQKVVSEYLALGQRPDVVAGQQLQPVDTATTVRVQDQRTLTTDGPFADTKEVLGGFFLLEADNIDEAIDVASQVPAARLGGSVEIRPLVER
jgi:hypothetical protein